MNPLLSQDLFVGRHKQVEELGALLGNGHSALLVGGRRTGKTTLARQLAIVGIRRELIFTDVSGWDLTSEHTSLGGLLAAIHGKPESTYKQASRHDIDTVLASRVPVTLVIDEADRLLQTSWCGGFFSYLRHLDDWRFRADISILLIGGPVLMQFRDVDDRGSPPLNTAEPTFMDPLDPNAVRSLVDLIDRGYQVDLDELMTIGGGQAFLTVRLLAAIWSGSSILEASDIVYDNSVSVFEVWERQLGQHGREMLRYLPPGGWLMADVRAGRAGRHARSIVRLARAIGAVRVDRGRLLPGPELFTTWLLERTEDELTWDLAISYATADVAAARSIAMQLRAEFKVFFAPDESGALWGTDLERILPNTYGIRSRLVVVLCTEEYLRRYWTSVEYEAVVSRNPDRVLLLEMGALPAEIPVGAVYRRSSNGEMVGLLGALRSRLRNSGT